MIQDSNLQNSIERFIDSQVVSRGLDERTKKAYQLDLELFFRWMQENGKKSWNGKSDDSKNKDKKIDKE